MQSQQGIFQIKRSAPQRSNKPAIARGRGRGISPYLGPRFEEDQEQYVFEASEKITIGTSELFNLQDCGLEYQVPEGNSPTKVEKIILDNLWYSFKQKHVLQPLWQD